MTEFHVKVEPFGVMGVRSSTSHLLHEFVSKSHDIRLSLTLAKRTTLEPHATVCFGQRSLEFRVLLSFAFLGCCLGLFDGTF